MKIKVNKTNDYARELEIDIPWSELESDFNTTIKKFSKKVKMPGFRAGKIPRNRLMQQFQANIEAEFMENNFQKYYLMAVQQEELLPVNKAEISDVHFHMNEHFSFKAVFEIEPEAVIPKLKRNSLSVQRTIYIHDEHDIEDAIMQLRKSHSTIATVEDGAIEGDYLICTLQKLDESGVPIIGKKFEKQYLRVGKGSFTDNQKEKLIGLKPGDSTRVILPVNQEGENAEYELTVGNVEREILPEINEEFLKRINPDLDSIDALTSDVEKKIKANFEERSRTAYERDLSDALIDLASPSFAPSMVENYLANLTEDVKKQNKGEPMDEEKVREHYTPVAERNVKWYSLRNKLIETQDIAASKENVEDYIEKLVERTPQSEKEIRKFYKKPSNRKRVSDDLVEKKILEYLEQFAKVKEVEVYTKDLRGQDHAH
ncbi:MAG TPA: trigger factor [Candidatus Marinimicrobia bacterium]|nr:trigger factor [Candidatus Neomarinimicrobiota bacterium]